MIPATPEEKDAFLADVSAAILTTLAPSAFTEEQTVSMSEGLLEAKRAKRIAFAVAEAQGLLAALAPLAQCQRFDDGAPVDPRAANPALNGCAHGVPLDKPCAACAAGDINAGAEGAGNGDALAAFHDNLQGGAGS